MRTLQVIAWWWALAAIPGIASAQIRIDPLLDLSGSTTDPALSPDGRTLAFTWLKPDSPGIYTRPLTGGQARLLAGNDGHEGWASSPHWSPDSRQIAFVRGHGRYDDHVIVKDLASGVERDLGEICGLSAWTPDGSYLVAGEYTHEIPDGVPVCSRALFSTRSGTRLHPLAPAGIISPDGRRLAFADGGSLKLLRLTADYRPAGPATVLAREPRDISPIVWTADSRQIVYQALGDVLPIRRVKLAAGSRPEPIPGVTAGLWISQFLRDGTALATETIQDSGLWRAGLQAAPPKIERTAEPACSDGAPGCSPDGRSRAFITTRTGIPAIWLADADGSHEHPLVPSMPEFAYTHDTGHPAQIAWSPDGKWIAFTVLPDPIPSEDGGHLRGFVEELQYLYVVASSGGLPRRLGQQAFALDNPAWSKDSASLYATRYFEPYDRAHPDESPIVRVGLTDGKLTPTGADGTHPQPSPDGKFLYFFTHSGNKLARIAIASGAEERLADNQEFSSLSVGARFLYLFRMTGSASVPAYTLVRFDPESEQAAALAEVRFSPQSPHLSPDERFLYFEQPSYARLRVVLVHGLY